MNIDKDIKELKELIREAEHCHDIDAEEIPTVTYSYAQSIRNVLSELEKKDNIIDLMSRAILNYDDQLVINKYRNKEEVKKYFEENYEELMKRYDR